MASAAAAHPANSATRAYSEYSNSPSPAARSRSAPSPSTHTSTSSPRRHYHPFSKQTHKDGPGSAGKKPMKGETKKKKKRVDDRRSSTWSLGSHGSLGSLSVKSSESAGSAAADIQSHTSDRTNVSSVEALMVSDPLENEAELAGSGMLVEPLPLGWSIRHTTDGKPYFVDEVNRTTTWLDPRTNRPAIWGTQQASQANVAKYAKFASADKLPLPEGWEMGVTDGNTPYYINHNDHITTWVDPRSVLFQQRSLEGQQQRMKIKELKRANEELQVQIRRISEQQRQLEQEVLHSASPETLALAKMTAMADAQRILEEQYRQAAASRGDSRSAPRAGTRHRGGRTDSHGRGHGAGGRHAATGNRAGRTDRLVQDAGAEAARGAAKSSAAMTFTDDEEPLPISPIDLSDLLGSMASQYDADAVLGIPKVEPGFTVDLLDSGPAVLHSAPHPTSDRVIKVERDAVGRSVASDRARAESSGTAAAAAPNAGHGALLTTSAGVPHTTDRVPSPDPLDGIWSTVGSPSGHLQGVGAQEGGGFMPVELRELLELDALPDCAPSLDVRNIKQDGEAHSAGVSGDLGAEDFGQFVGSWSV